LEDDFWYLLCDFLFVLSLLLNRTMLKMKIKVTSTSTVPVEISSIRMWLLKLPGSVGEGTDPPSVAVLTVATVEGAIVILMGAIVVVVGVNAVMLGGIVVLPVMDATIISPMVATCRSSGCCCRTSCVCYTSVYPVIVVVFTVDAEAVIVEAATLGLVVIKTVVVLVILTVFIVADILVLIASVAAVGVSVVSLVFNKFGPEFSAVEAEDVTPAIVVGVAVLVCTVLNFAVLYIIVVLVAVDVMIMSTVSGPLVVVMAALCVKVIIVILISNVMGGIMGAREVVVADMPDL
jgi:hypothetical protein